MNSNGVGFGRDPKDYPDEPAMKADLQFPVHKLCNLIVGGGYSEKVSHPAPVFLSAVLQYITAEVLELAGKAAKEENRPFIQPSHIKQAITSDEGLNQLLGELFEPAAMDFNVEVVASLLAASTIADNHMSE